jgi:hypothetical protein
VRRRCQAPRAGCAPSSPGGRGFERVRGPRPDLGQGEPPLNGQLPALTGGTGFHRPQLRTTIRASQRRRRRPRRQQGSEVGLLHGLRVEFRRDLPGPLPLGRGGHVLARALQRQDLRLHPQADRPSHRGPRAVLLGHDAPEHHLRRERPHPLPVRRRRARRPAPDRAARLHAQCGTKTIYGGGDPLFNSWDSKIFGLVCNCGGPRSATTA